MSQHQHQVTRRLVTITKNLTSTQSQNIRHTYNSHSYGRRVTGHNPPRSGQWQGRIKPTESHIAYLKDKLIGGRNPPGHNPWFRTP